jgi:hypothetical protein
LKPSEAPEHVGSKTPGPWQSARLRANTVVAVSVVAANVIAANVIAASVVAVGVVAVEDVAMRVFEADQCSETGTGP